MAEPKIVTEALSDDYIERWGAIFVKHRLNFALNITFEQFLRVPVHYLIKYHELMNSDDHKKAVQAVIDGNEYGLLLEQQALRRERLYQQSIDQAIANCANGHSTVDDADLLERVIRAARGIRWLPRQNNGHPIEKLTHTRHPKSRAMFPAGGKS